MAEVRLGFVGIVVEDRTQAARVNEILSHYGEIIRGRMGIPDQETGEVYKALRIKFEAINGRDFVNTVIVLDADEADSLIAGVVASAFVPPGLAFCVSSHVDVNRSAVESNGDVKVGFGSYSYHDSYDGAKYRKPRVFQQIEEIIFVENKSFLILHTRRLVCNGISTDGTFADFVNYAFADITFFHKILLLYLYETIIAYIFV